MLVIFFLIQISNKNEFFFLSFKNEKFEIKKNEQKKIIMKQRSYN